MRAGLTIAFFGSSLLSAYRNPHATYFRGLLQALATRGHRVTFHEPDRPDRRRHRDIDAPPWARVRLYEESERGVLGALQTALGADAWFTANGVGGPCEDLLERALVDQAPAGTLLAYWDVDPVTTLPQIARDPEHRLRNLAAKYDLLFTRGGGEPVVRAYLGLGARVCLPIPSATDPATHYPVPHDPRFTADLAFLGNRRPEREARVDEFLVRPATLLPRARFILGGVGWEDRALPDNVRTLGYLYTSSHNAFNASPRAVLHVSCRDTERFGVSPPSRIFEAAGAGACLVSDPWPGIDLFLEPGREVLVAADGLDVVGQLQGLSPERARQIGGAARRRVLARHTYAQRAARVHALLAGVGQPAYA